MEKILSEKDVESLAESLIELLRRLQSDKIALEKRIAQVETNLDLIKSGIKKETLVSASKTHHKRPYGQNPKRIRKFLAENPDKKFKSDEIAAQLCIARSSTYATLKRLEEKGIAETVDGLWRKKTL